jgi:hypothetical protein
MTPQKRKYRFTFCCLLSLALAWGACSAPTWAEEITLAEGVVQANDVEASTLKTWRMSLGLGYDHYTEHELGVVFQGPELQAGLQLELPNGTQLEADALLGSQRYSGSGTRSSIGNTELRGRALYALDLGASSWRNLNIGLAVHYTYNDFGGRTSTGSMGYTRESFHLWLPVRWCEFTPSEMMHASQLEIETALLLYGRHVSKLSESGAGYSDAINLQHRGVYVQIKKKWQIAPSFYLEPYLRMTFLGQSDTVAVGNNQVANEPRNRRIQAGVNWVW